MSTVYDFASDGLEIIPSSSFNASTMTDVTTDLSPVMQPWTQLLSGASIRYGATAVAIGTDMFVFGGVSSVYYNDVWKYDTLLYNWTQLTSGATGRNAHSAVAIGTDMFIFGGFSAGVYYNDLWKYNTVLNTWLQPTYSGTAPSTRYGPTAVAIGTDMFIFGGYNGTTYLNDLWKYNTITDTWSPPLAPTGNIPLIRRYHSAVAIGTDMFVFGGNNGTTYLNDLWKYDTLLNTWTQLLSGASVRRNHTAVAIGTDMFIFGGYNGTTYFNDLWKYDTLLNTWTQLLSGASIRDNLSAVAIGTDMFIFGGFNTAALNDTWKFNSTTLVLPNAHQFVLRDAS